jgi:hypothetical protein
LPEKATKHPNPIVASGITAAMLIARAIAFSLSLSQQSN